MGETREGLQGIAGVAGRLAQEAGNGFGDHAMFLGTRPPLDQHVQVQLLGRQAFQSILTDGPEPVFLHISEQAVLQVGISQFPGM